MIWLLILLLATAALAPLLPGLRRAAAARGTRDMALNLHRGQLAELDRDLAEGRIAPPEHATATLEVQRRLLAAADRPDADARPGSRRPLAVTLVLVPVAALALYLVGGHPFLPSLPPGAVQARQQQAAQEAQLVAALRDRLSAIDPASEQGRQGFLLLGTVEEARGNDAAAAEAFRTVLAAAFDPLLALRAADAAIRAENGLSAPTAALLRRALAEAPPDAPWRATVEARLKQSGF